MANSPAVLLSLSDDHATDTQLQALTQDLASDLRREIGARPSAATEEGPSGSFRGDPMAIGKLVVELLSSSAAGALINLLAAHFSRKPHLSIELKRPDGETLTITSSDTDEKNFENTVEKARHFLPE